MGGVSEGVGVVNDRGDLWVGSEEGDFGWGEGGRKRIQGVLVAGGWGDGLGWYGMGWDGMGWAGMGRGGGDLRRCFDVHPEVGGLVGVQLLLACQGSEDVLVQTHKTLWVRPAHTENESL